MSNGIDFTMELPADPTWEPMSFADVLEQDGCYSGTVVGEKTVVDGDKPGVWLTIELADADVRGRRLQKFLPDLQHAPKQAFNWRGIIMSMHGKEAARSAFRYQKGVFTGGTVFFKTGAYTNNKTGDVATGIDEWLLKADYEQAVAKNAHRWPRKVEGKSGAPGAFGLPTAPTGLPTGFGAPVPQPAPAAAPPISGAAAATAQPAAAPAVPQPPKANGFPSFPGLGK